MPIPVTLNAMSRRKRRLIFYALMIVFLIAGPLIAAYAFGYAFNFSTARFQRTGGIFIKSPTPRLAVFLDGAMVKETGFLSGSTLLPDLLPGTHLVRLEKEGFRPWSKTVRVAPAEVMELRNILLIPQPVPAATSTAGEMADAAATSTPAMPFSLDARGRLTAGRGARVILENVHSYAYAPEAGAVFFVDKNGFFAQYETASGKITSIGRPGFFLTDERLRFVAGGKFVAIIDPSGGLFLYDESTGTIDPVTGGVSDAAFDSEENKLLVMQEHILSILWLADNTHQPFQKKAVLEEIVSTDSAVRQARWFYKTDSHVVWRSRNGVFLTEIDRRGGASTGELVAYPVDEIGTFVSLPDTVFYRRGKNIFRMDL